MTQEEIKNISLFLAGVMVVANNTPESIEKALLNEPYIMYHLLIVMAIGVVRLYVGQNRGYVVTDGQILTKKLTASHA